MLCTALRLLLAAVLLAALSASAEDSGADQLDLLLNNKRLVSRYVQCLLGRKRCPPEGTELKRLLPDALATRCSKCSPFQKDAALVIIRRLRADYPAEWAELLSHWDPTGVHVKAFERALQRRRSRWLHYERPQR